MSSPPETTKKRKADDYQGGGDCESNAATDKGGTTLAAILSKMKDMKSEMNDMKGRLSRMDELEKKCQIQEENIDRLESKCQIQEKNLDKLENKCKSLEVKCESLERSMQILIEEQKYEYSAPSIPMSYWVDLGLGEENIAGMECLLKQMKDMTIELRSGKDNVQRHILLSGGFDDEDDETILLHDDILLPHWKEFANALALYQNSRGLLTFFIRHVQLTS